MPSAVTSDHCRLYQAKLLVLRPTLSLVGCEGMQFSNNNDNVSSLESLLGETTPCYTFPMTSFFCESTTNYTLSLATDCRM